VSLCQFIETVVSSNFIVLFCVAQVSTSDCSATSCLQQRESLAYFAMKIVRDCWTQAVAVAVAVAVALARSEASLYVFICGVYMY
jgi:hypothetical protein